MGPDPLSGVQKFFGREESSWMDEAGQTLAALARQDRAMTEDMRRMLADFGRRDRAMAEDTRRMIEDFARREKETFEGTRRMMDVISRLGLKQSEHAPRALRLDHPLLRLGLLAELSACHGSRLFVHLRFD